MTDVKYPRLSLEEATTPINLECPFCGHRDTLDWDKHYSPRYHNCSACGEKYIYEPMASVVRCSKPDEVDCSGDPDCRELENLSMCEE